MNLLAPKSFHEASPELIEKVCNGCGPEGLLGKIIPDHLLWKSIKQACQIHDWMYHEGVDKLTADVYFLANMIIICAQGNKLLFIPRTILAVKYFHAVFYGGGEYFEEGEVMVLEISE